MPRIIITACVICKRPSKITSPQGLCPACFGKYKNPKNDHYLPPAQVVELKLHQEAKDD